MTASRPAVRAVTATLLAAAIGLIAPACSSGGSGGSSSDTKVSITDGAATADKTTSTVATTAPVATTLAPTPTGLPDQEAAATKLYDAWFANDKVTASTVADPAAIDNIWMAAKGDYYLYNKCSTGEFDTSGCLFRGNNGTIQIDLEKRGENWVVSGAFFSPPGTEG